ncbi:MAG TPA: NADH-quinone oxidoreductase subunit C [Verrucomicrobiae bacterium]|nr:NADH-quinone oxidoreductase subunit C [Verrucomicrobiae bacterium]
MSAENVSGNPQPPAGGQQGSKSPGAGTPPAAVLPAPAPVPPPAFLANVPLPFQGAEYVLKGYHAEATVGPHEVVWAAEQMDLSGFALDTITGVDWLTSGSMEVVYDYFHPVKPLRAVVRVRVPRDKPEVPTISPVFPGANWHEREAHDFFGIRFLGHPNLAPFLLPEDATYHPLRKDFSA